MIGAWQTSLGSLFSRFTSESETLFVLFFYVIEDYSQSIGSAAQLDCCYSLCD